MKVLKISSKSEVKLVAGSITWQVLKQGCTEVQTIGASAVNQAVKAIAIARSYLSLRGAELMCFPAFKKHCNRERKPYGDQFNYCSNFFNRNKKLVLK